MECAILEINGTLSVLKKEQYQNTTKQDLPLPSSAGTVPIELVYDGKILYENLSKHTYDEDWLMAELEKEKTFSFGHLVCCRWDKRKLMY